jgi:WD40 repeat protein
VHIAFSPDGTTLASIGGGGLVFFDVATGRQLGDELRGPPVGVDLLETSTLAVRPQGDDVATGNATDNSVIVWGPLPLNVDIAAVRRHFCAIAGRNLTRAEWRLFVPGEPYHRTCTP